MKDKRELEREARLARAKKAMEEGTFTLELLAELLEEAEDLGFERGEEIFGHL